MTTKWTSYPEIKYLYDGEGRLYGVVANIVDCNIVVSKFIFELIPLGKLKIPPDMG